MRERVRVARRLFREGRDKKAKRLLWGNERRLTYSRVDGRAKLRGGETATMRPIHNAVEREQQWWKIAAVIAFLVGTVLAALFLAVEFT